MNNNEYRDMHKHAQKELNYWLNRYDNKDMSIKKGIIIHGDTGVGKTTLVKNVLNKLNKNIAYYDASDIRNKEFVENISRVIKYNISYEYYFDNKLSKLPVIVMDELESMYNSHETSTIMEFVKILNPLKGKTSVKKVEKLKIQNTWTTPIIFICNNIKSNKLTQLIKECDNLYIPHPTVENMISLVNTHHYKLQTLEIIAEKSKGDINFFLNAQEFYKHGSYIDIEKYESQNIFLYNRAQNAMMTNMTIQQYLNEYYTDISMMPCMISENIYNYCSDDDDLAHIASSISDSDLIVNSIFLNNNFVLEEYYGISSLVAPCKAITKKKSKADCDMRFPSSLSKNAFVSANKKSVKQLYRGSNMQPHIEHLILLKSYLFECIKNKDFERAVEILKDYNILPTEWFNTIKVKLFVPAHNVTITMKDKQQLMKVYNEY